MDDAGLQDTIPSVKPRPSRHLFLFKKVYVPYIFAMKILFAMLLVSIAAGAQAQITQARPSESATMNDAENVVTVDHTGFAVLSLDEAIRFWTEALGFTLERQSDMGGDFLYQVTGVDDPSVKTAIVRAPDGYVVELLQYSKGFQNGVVPNSAGAIGAVHLALTVKDIHAAIARVEAAGWKAKGSPLPIAGGPRTGTLVAYVSGPDHITIELMQPPTL